jgi:hypothetical protein
VLSVIVPPGPTFYANDSMLVLFKSLFVGWRKDRHTSFLVSMAGKELSKSSRSSTAAPPEGCAGADVKSASPPNRSSSPSSTVAEGLLSVALKRSASSPSRARSRSRKSPWPLVSGRMSVSPAGGVSDGHKEPRLGTVVVVERQSVRTCVDVLN